MKSENRRSNEKGNTSPPLLSCSEPNGQERTEIDKPKASISEQAFVDRIKISDRWMIGLTGAIVATGIISAFIFAGQLSIMNGQLSEMKSSGLQEDRLVEANGRFATAVEQQALALRGNMRYNGLTIQSNSWGWWINPTWSNVGGTDAKNYIGWWTTIPEPRNPSVQIDQYPTLPCPSVLQPIARPHGIVVQPGGGQQQISRAISVRELAKSTGQNAQEILYAVGHIEYNDIFPGTITHTVEWCVIISPEDIAKGVASQFTVSMEAK
jgi:hypothetical protein